MESDSTTKTVRLLKFMRIVSWVIFVGLLIQTGTYLVKYLLNLAEPDKAILTFDRIDVSAILEYSFMDYSVQVLMAVASFGINALIWYQLIKVFSELDINNPFGIDLVKKLEMISYILAGSAAISFFYNMHTEIIMLHIDGFYGLEVPNTSILIAVVVYIISQIFRRGVEIQNENKLTV